MHFFSNVSLNNSLGEEGVHDNISYLTTQPHYVKKVECHDEFLKLCLIELGMDYNFESSTKGCSVTELSKNSIEYTSVYEKFFESIPKNNSSRFEITRNSVPIISMKKNENS